MRERWRRLRGETRPEAWIALGGFFALSGLLTVLRAPAALLDRAAYERAASCAAPADGCLPVVHGVVERTEVERYRRDAYYVWLRLADPAGSVRVELPVPDDVFAELTPGREVTVRLWEGSVARVEVPGAGRAETSDSPVSTSVEQPATGWLVLTAGAFSVWTGLALRTGRAMPLMARDRYGAIGRAIVAALAGAFGGVLLVVALDSYSGRGYAGVLALGSAVAWALLRRGSLRRGAPDGRG